MGMPKGSTMSIRKHQLRAVYVLTTIGTSFRVWYQSPDEDSLSKLHGPRPGTLHGYIDANSDPTGELQKWVQMAKEDPPLVEAPVVPSQALPQAGFDYGAEDYQQGGGYYQGGGEGYYQ